MRVTWKRDYLVPYLIDSVVHTTRKEKVYWTIVLSYAIIFAAVIIMKSNWWLGSIFFILTIAAGRFPMHYRLNEIGKYPMSERQYYEVIRKEE